LIHPSNLKPRQSKTGPNRKARQFLANDVGDWSKFPAVSAAKGTSVRMEGKAADSVTVVPKWTGKTSRIRRKHSANNFNK